MGNDVDTHKDRGSKKKTPFQQQSLENFFSENKYPKKEVIENYAASLNLTYKQIRTWFVERRRKEKREIEAHCSIKKHIKSHCSIKKHIIGNDRGQVGRKDKLHASSKDAQPGHLQVLFPKDYILKRVFRKDGPPLGVEFDPLPANSFRRDTKDLHSYQDIQRAHKRRKVMESHLMDPEILHRRNIPVKKHGVGKGLMTTWRAMTYSNEKFPTGISFMNEKADWMPCGVNSSPKETSCQVSRRPQRVQPVPRQKTSRKQMQEKGKPHVKKRKALCSKDKNQKNPHPSECSLSLDESSSLEQSNTVVILIDDEELEIGELQSAPNQLSCPVHLASNRRQACPLCKDLLPRFPPQIVKMKQPFCTRPWDSSPELVKKMFKVFQFLYGHATAVHLDLFTLDEFAQAFNDKDSLLLGKIHVALLKMLLLDVERETSAGYASWPSTDCRFLGFLHFVREQEFDVSFWSLSLNPLTWTEILRQVLIAAGFGSKNNTTRKEFFSKERNHMTKYGLQPRTLKGELFRMLSEKGSSGLKVSELAKTSQIRSLDLPNTSEELEELIFSALSSDITLFEKIAPSSYRLRIDPRIKGKDDSQSDTEDSGSVSDESGDSSEHSSSEESDDSEELHLAIHKWSVVKYKARRRKEGQVLAEYNEIDESYTGELWVLGLMEGDYSNLSVEEKLDALLALVDLAGSGCSFRIEEPVKAATSSFPGNRYHRSGAKIKKSLTTRHPTTRETQKEPAHGAEESDASVHPNLSIYLGSDRRYNSYWLFLGPCNPNDPGHRRVYFESSEDGHWEVIDTAQDLHALLSVLDPRGLRESCLFASLEKRKGLLCQAMHDFHAAEIRSRPAKGPDPSDTENSTVDCSSPISDIDNLLLPLESTDSLLAVSGSVVLVKNVKEKKERWNRLQLFDKWLWDFFYSKLSAVKNSKGSFMESLVRCESCHDLYWRDEKHCKICHCTFEVDFDTEERYAIHVATCKEAEDSSEFPNHKVLPSQLQVLKAAIHAIELSLPEEALVGAWKRSGRKLWVKRLRRTSSLSELLQVLADFIGTINEEWLHECVFAVGPNTAIDEIVVYFQTMPQTTSAVALWMVKLDMLIAPHLERLKSEKTLGNTPQSKRYALCTK